MIDRQGPEPEAPTPPHGTPIAPAAPATVRPGPHIVEPDRGDIPEVASPDLLENLEAARALFAESPDPFNDPSYRQRHPGLRVLWQRLHGMAREQAGDIELFDLFVEVGGMLLRRDVK
jgi:hypothetical protein